MVLSRENAGVSTRYSGSLCTQPCPRGAANGTIECTLDASGGVCAPPERCSDTSRTQTDDEPLLPTASTGRPSHLIGLTSAQGGLSLIHISEPTRQAEI